MRSATSEASYGEILTIGVATGEGSVGEEA